jgi:diphosphate-dependent phosphofructokinase
MQKMSVLQKARLQFVPPIPKVLQDILSIRFVDGSEKKIDGEVRAAFAKLSHFPELTLASGDKTPSKPVRVGVVLSGGQAAGGHNVIAGVFDALKTLHPESKLFGFLNGPGGIIKGKYKEITEELLANYRNQGGFDLIGSGRTKVETPEQFALTLEVVQNLNLDGLVIIGGDDSNTNAAVLAEFFLREGCKTSVVGVPKTIDGDLQNERVEISFGFDTACKIYSETIGNIARDALSAKKYYYFVKLMGRSASHITLECAFQTEPNLALIGEEIEAQSLTLSQVALDIADLITQRAIDGKDFGTILIPEGTIEFLVDVKELIAELNKLLASESDHAQKLANVSNASEKIAYVEALLSNSSKKCFKIMPELIQLQLLIDRDPHGNVQVSKIETERLFMAVVDEELKKRKAKGEYKGKFSPQAIFCGYEGRSALPSNFDATYCYSLGRLAALLVVHKRTGYMAAISGLAKKVSEWGAYGVPLASLMHFEERDGKIKAVIKKTLVDLKGKPFKLFSEKRDAWRLQDSILEPGPIQFFGAEEITNTLPYILTL